MTDNLISIKEIATRLRVQPATVRGWIYHKTMPAPDIKGHRFVRWEKSTIELFLKDPVAWRKKQQINNSS